MAASGSNINVTISADAAKLRAEFAVAQAEANRFKEQLDKVASRIGSLSSGTISNNLAAQLQLAGGNALIAEQNLARLRAEMDQLNHSASGLSFATAGVVREMIVLGHEGIFQQSMSRMAGSMLVLTERLGGLQTLLGGLTGSMIAVGAAGAAVVGILGFIGYRAYEASQAIDKVNGTLLLTGRLGQSSASDIGSWMSNLQSGFSISASQAQQTVASWASVHTLTVDQAKALSELSIEYSKIAGADLTSTVKKWTSDFEEGAKGAIELASHLNIDTEEMKKMLATGDAAGALAETIRQLTKWVSDHGGAVEKATGTWRSFWDTVASGMAGGVEPFQYMQQFGSPPPAPPTGPRTAASGWATGAEGPLTGDVARDAFLRTLRGGESSGVDPYHQLYGGGHFYQPGFTPGSWAGMPGPTGRPTHAAGAYGFETAAWNQYGKGDFGTPANQDAAAWSQATEVYRNNTGRDLEADLQSGQTQYVQGALGGTWPGGVKNFQQRYQQQVAAGPEGVPYGTEEERKAEFEHAKLDYDDQVAAAKDSATQRLGIEQNFLQVIGSMYGKNSTEYQEQQNKIKETARTINDQQLQDQISALKQQEDATTDYAKKVQLQRQIIGALAGAGKQETPEYRSAQQGLANLGREEYQKQSEVARLAYDDQRNAARDSVAQRLSVEQQYLETVKSLYGENSLQYREQMNRVNEASRQLGEDRLQVYISQLKAQQDATSDFAKRIQLQQQIIGALQNPRSVVPEYQGPGRQDSAEYRSAQTQLAALKRESIQQQVQEGIRGASEQEQIDRAYAAQFRVVMQTMVDQKKLTTTQAIGFEEQYTGQLEAEEVKRLQMLMADDNTTTAEKKELYMKLLSLYADYASKLDEMNKQIADSARKANEDLVKSFERPLDTLGSDLTRSLNDALVGKTSIAKAGRQIGQDLATSILEEVEHGVGRMGATALSSFFGTAVQSAVKSAQDTGATGLSALFTSAIGIGQKGGLFGTGLFGATGAAGGVSQAAATTANTTALTALTTAVASNTAALAGATAAEGTAATASAAGGIGSAAGAAGGIGSLFGDVFKMFKGGGVVPSFDAGGVVPAFARGGLIPGHYVSGFRHLSFAMGGIVPSAAGGMVLSGSSGTPAILHPKEMVLPAHLSQGVQNMINGGGGGGDAHFHFHGPADSQSIDRWYKGMLSTNGPSVIKDLLHKSAISYRNS